ncbi:glycosyltransferase family 2 protein [Cytophagaceae bacterium ABcell3]|nr:glycosyltransferase family 2 protein [Cytophagaceae bacterium ABcell3]
MKAIKYQIKKCLYYFSFLFPWTLNYKLFRNSLKENRGTDSVLFFSIIIPTYNRAKLLKKAVDSVLSQTYPHYEILIIDDGSNDGTQDMVYKVFSEDLLNKKIRYVNHPHKGVGYARNKGLEIAQGDFIAYLDSDNIWHKNFLSIMYNALKTGSVDCAYCAMSVFNEVDKMVFTLFNSPFNRKKLLKTNFIDLNCFVHKRELYLIKGGFDETLTRLLDWDLILKYTSGTGVLPVPALLVRYKIRKSIQHITTSKPLEENEKKILSKWS